MSSISYIILNTKVYMHILNDPFSPLFSYFPTIFGFTTLALTF